jgi:hypothetical protein
MALNQKYLRYLALIQSNELYNEMERTSTRLLNELSTLQIRYLQRFGVAFSDTPIATELLNQLRKGDSLYRHLHRALRIVGERIGVVRDMTMLQAGIGSEASEP